MVPAFEYYEALGLPVHLKADGHGTLIRYRACIFMEDTMEFTITLKHWDRLSVAEQTQVLNKFSDFLRTFLLLSQNKEDINEEDKEQS
jgi:hypothetical protein